MIQFEGRDSMERPNLARKEVLNPLETIEHFVLSRRKFYELIEQDRLEFMAYYGSRKLIIRTEFEKYLEKHPELRRRDRSDRLEKRQ